MNSLATLTAAIATFSTGRVEFYTLCCMPGSASHRKGVIDADKKGQFGLDDFMEMSWSTRGPAMVAAAAQQPGSKFLLTVDDASVLPEMVRKGLMVADHVII